MGVNMLSRVADTIYWMARYMERTDGMLQVLRTSYISTQDDVCDFSWRKLLFTYGNELPEEEISKIEKDTSKVFEYLILDKANRSSAYNNVLQSRENARAIQDHITKEVWQCLNSYYHLMRTPEIEEQVKNEDPVTGIDQLIRNGLLFTGTVKNTMTRDEAYTYLHIGKFLERAIITTDIIRTKLSETENEGVQSGDAKGLRYLLYSLSGYEIYMKTYKGDFNTQDVLELTVHNTFFPHSLIYSVYQMNKYFERLKPESFPENYEHLEFLIGKTLNNIKYTKLDADEPDAINLFLSEIRDELIETGNSFSRYYFGNT